MQIHSSWKLQVIYQVDTKTKEKGSSSNHPWPTSWPLCGPYHHFQDFLFLFMLNIVLNDVGRILGSFFSCRINLGPNKRLSSIINPNRISNSICRNVAPNVACLQTYYCNALQSLDEQTAGARFLWFNPFLSCLALFRSQRFGHLAATLPQRPVLARLQ